MRKMRLPIINSGMLYVRCLTLLAVTLLVITASLFKGRASCSGNTHALFSLNTPAGSPFPSNRFTVADASQNTGLRVNLPKPVCSAYPSDCEDLDVINTLDGFNLQPRLSISFDGPIDVTTVTSDTVFLIKLGDTLNPDEGSGRRVGINQVVWDQLTNTLHAQSDEQLDQHSRYALVVTRGVRDQSGLPVEASEAFHRFRHDLNLGQADDPGLKSYRKALLKALRAARRAGVAEGEIVSASVFTTQSATAILEKIRDQIKATTPAPADFNLGLGGSRTVFPLDQITSITWHQQIGDSPPRFTALQLNLSALRSAPGVVGQIAFGKYLSPDYMVHPGEYIPSVGTRTGSPVVQGMNEIYFNLYLPSGSRPAAGWPVAIYGHGTGGNKNGRIAPSIPFDSLAVAATMASHGIATIAINANGHGFGPLGTLTINHTGGPAATFPDGGRAIDQNRDGQIGNPEGNDATAPRRIQLLRDGLLQTDADLIQMVRVIEVGMDTDGDGSSDLDPSRIYYFGHSLGGMYGTNFVAVEPNVRAAVFNVPGAPFIENRRLNAAQRPGLGRLFAMRQPSLINSPGLTQIGGLSVAPPHFNENLPLRDQSPVVNTIAGAMELQEWFDRAVWAAQAASPAAYAPHLRRKPLPGVPAKPVIFQFARGDMNAPNPNTTTILRAGDLADRATFFRNDLAFAENPAVPKNPHGFLLPFSTGSPAPLIIAIARGTQEQIAVFFAFDGAVVIHPEPARFFEVPIMLPLPEGLNYIP